MINRDEVALRLLGDLGGPGDRGDLDLIKAALSEYGEAKRVEGYNAGYEDGFEEGWSSFS